MIITISRRLARQQQASQPTACLSDYRRRKRGPSDRSGPPGPAHADGMRTWRITRLAVAAAAMTALAACGGTPSPGAQQSTGTTPAPGTSAPPASPPVTSPRGTPASTAPPAAPAPRPSATSPASPGTRPVTGSLAGKDWTVIPTTRRAVALTFDAGANADAVPAILATLRRDGVPATFFLTGHFVRDFPAAARSIATGG